MLAIHHVSFLITDCEISEQFYSKVLGLEPSKSRPDLGFPGIWYDLKGLQIHLIQEKIPYHMDFIPEHGGRDRHLALSTKNLSNIINKLEQMNISYTRSKSGRAAIFFRDPDLNVLEIIENLER
ncbi:MAG: VOC family protein [Gammaproteobacteria bacterium]|nr:VOC family protein [Gammaproteobacteria bacterium]